MSKKTDSKKGKTGGVELSAEESDELQMILDRLAVQDPEGESLGTYLQSLLKALSGRERLMAALVDHLGKNPTPAGFRAFVVFQDAVQDKSYGRLVKQAAYRFSQKGFAAVSDVPQPERVVLVQRETRQPVAHLIPAPGTYGFITAYFPESAPAPKVLTAFAEGDWDHVWVGVSEGSLRHYRDYVKDLEDREEAGGKALEIPLYHAARLLSELLQWSGGKGVLADAARARELLRPFLDLERPPLVYEFMEPVDRAGERLEDIHVEELLAELDISWLLLPRAELEPYHHRFLEVDQSVLVVAPEIRQERMRDLFRSATDDLIAGSRRLFFQRYFEEQALVWKSSGREDLAEWTWISAQHLKSPEKVSLSELMVGLLMVSLRNHWPDDFTPSPDVAEKGYHVTESGLILPP